MEYLWIIPVVLLALAAIYLFLLFPAVRRHKDRELMKGLYIAHRGLHNETAGVPENSLRSYRAAINAGFAIEIDIHLTKDGQVAVFHDDTTKRVCGKDMKIEESTLAQLKELRLSQTDEQIPTLQEVLALVDGKVPLLIEFKIVKGNTLPLCEAADAILSAYRGKYFIQSFYPPVLQWYRRHRKEICRGQLATDFSRMKGQGPVKWLAGWLLFNVISRPDFVSYDHHYTSSFSRSLCTSLGALPVAWTLRSKEETEKIKGYYAAYIFENYLPKK